METNGAGRQEIFADGDCTPESRRMNGMAGSARRVTRYCRWDYYECGE
jgi:hypothetical protein